MKFFLNYSVVALFCIFIFTLGYAWADLPQSFENIFKFILIFLNLLILALSFFFAKSKPFVLLFIPLFFYFYFYYPSFLGLDGGKISFWYTYPLVLCFGFVIISFLSERAIISFYGATKIVITLLLLLIGYFFLKSFAYETKQALETSIIGFNISFVKLPETILLIIIFSTITLYLSTSIFYQGEIDKSLFLAFLAFIIPSLFFQDNLSFLLFSILGELFIGGAILKESYKMSYRDTLTTIPSRRALEHEFLKLSSKYSIAMIDIDHFKKFNDTYGHDIGDEVLKLIASEISQVKGGGKAFRYGGEEFTVLFKNKNADEAYMYLEEIREAIAKRGFTIRDKDRPKVAPLEKPKSIKNPKKVNLSVSIGLANSSKQIKSPFEVVKKADTALYQAKENGRNCIVKSYL